MPSTTIFKSGWPTVGKPIEANASVGNDGLITGTAKFLVASESSAYPVNSEVPASMFKSLSGTNLQGALYVEQRSLETRQGITTLTISVVGALNPPVLVYSASSSIGSYSETKSYGEENESSNTFSVSYIAETCSVSYWKNKKSIFSANPKSAILVRTFAQSGAGILYAPGAVDFYQQVVYRPAGFISRELLPLNTSAIESRSNLEKVTVTQQLVVV